MTDKTQLVVTLKNQHRGLQADLAQTKFNSDNGKFAEAYSSLSKFKSDLVLHLQLENGTFYPDYLKQTTERGGDATKIKGFIADMVEIGNKVSSFLEKYNSTKKISEDKANFTEELEHVINILNMRIELEEEGIYDIYAAT